MPSSRLKSIPRLAAIGLGVPCGCQPALSIQVGFIGAPSQAAVFSYDATTVGAEGLRRKTDGQPLRDVPRAPGSWHGLQQSVVLDRSGDGINRFHLGEVRDGRFVMLAT